MNSRMRFLSVPIVLLSLLCLPPLLHAQDAVDPKRSAAAEELLKAMHSEETMAKMMANQKENVKKMTASFMPKDLSPENLKRAEDLESTALDTIFQQMTWDSVKPDFIQIYSEVFTEKELKDLAAFYNTPIGQKFIEKMPDLQSKTIEIMQKRMTTLMPAIRAALQDAIQKANASGDATQQPAPQ